jgi:hypothetical protein
MQAVWSDAQHELVSRLKSTNFEKFIKKDVALAVAAD